MSRLKKLSWSGRILKAKIMFAFGVLLLILPQLRHAQRRRKGEVPFLVYYTFKRAPHSSSVYLEDTGICQ